MDDLDRREFLRRAGAFVASAALAPAWIAGRDAVDPRLRALARDVRGPVITPADAAYERARLVYNERFDAVRPLGVVQPRLGRRRQRRGARGRGRTGSGSWRVSGGHSYEGYSTTTGLVVDLRRLNGISMHTGGTVTIGAGARLIDVEAALAGRGRAIPTGSCATVGIGGLAQGGGVGLASRAFGTTADNIVSLGIVTADGRYLSATRSTTPTSTGPAAAAAAGTSASSRTSSSGRIRRRRSRLLRRLAVDAGDRGRARLAGVRAGPARRALPICLSATGTRRPSIRSGQLLGPRAALRSWSRRSTRVDGAQQTFGSYSYLDAQLRWAGCLGKTVAQCHLAGESPQGTLGRASFRAKSDYVNTPLTRAGDRDGRAAGSSACRRSGFGSARCCSTPTAERSTASSRARRRSSTATRCARRQYLAYWYGPGAGRRDAWIRGFHAAMRPHVSGFAYQNYIDRDLAGWQHAYYGTNYERLRHVKRQVDPDWFFRFPQAIEPAAG